MYVLHCIHRMKVGVTQLSDWAAPANCNLVRRWRRPSWIWRDDEEEALFPLLCLFSWSTKQPEDLFVWL